MLDSGSVFYAPETLTFEEISLAKKYFGTQIIFPVVVNEGNEKN